MGDKPTTSQDYDLDTQVGYNLRRANQRHVAIFGRHVGGLTPTQFATLARLDAVGGLSQNRLGRLTAMDSATIAGVVERLRAKGMVTSKPDENDQRLRLWVMTPKGKYTFERARDQALAAREETMAPLSSEEVATFEALLARLV